MKPTDWRNLSEEWKILLTVSLRFQEAQTPKDEILTVFAKGKEWTAAKVYEEIHGQAVDYPLWPDNMFLNQLLQLKDLYAQHSSIDSIYPLMYFPLLETLYLNHTDISELDGLILNNGLKQIYLDHTLIDDISYLSGMQLEVFSARDSNITELGPLRSQFTLKLIDLRDTPVDSLFMLEELPHLQVLMLSEKYIDMKQLDNFRERHPNCDVQLH
ncbi:hypothetical protein [Algivirga pacifica]|uniref:Leucine-rich repeat domain-containing protein n=1 Tax=Algivirga pacifica TaxID=1162670 RepID=A0ABP9CXP0_9BACT